MKTIFVKMLLISIGATSFVSYVTWETCEKKGVNL
jgi:hypothetical protein